MAGTQDARPKSRPSGIRCAPLALALIWVLQAGASFASGPTTPPTASDWPPAPPDTVADDWIHLGSGEWLRGTLLRLREGTLEFESEDLGKLALDWDKLSTLYSPLAHIYLFEDMQVVQGPAWMQGQEIRIQGADGIVKRSSKELLRIVRGGKSEWDYWDGKLSASLSLSSGNTRQLEVGGYAYVRRTTALSRFRLDYNGNVSSFDGSESENNHRINEKFDVYFSRRLFVTPLQIDVLIDRFQNIEVQATPSLSLGYQLFDRNSLEWTVNFGGGFQYTRFESTLASESRDRYRGTLVVSTRFESELTDQLDLGANFALGLPVPQVDEATYHFFGTLSIELTDVLDLDLSFTWDRVESPETASDGKRPKPDDFRTSIGLGLEF